MSVVALFDLDHTLLPIDSSVAWLHYFIRVTNAQDKDQLLATSKRFDEQYRQGNLNIRDCLLHQLELLSRYPRHRTDELRAEYVHEAIKPHIRANARALVNKHLEQGHCVALISATNHYLTSAIAEAFDIPICLSVKPAYTPDGEFTGDLDGTPTFAAGKITAVENFYAANNWTRDSVTSYFYSDSHNDLPLLNWVNHPVAVNPDVHVRARANEQGWPIIDLW